MMTRLHDWMRPDRWVTWRKFGYLHLARAVGVVPQAGLGIKQWRVARVHVEPRMVPHIARYALFSNLWTSCAAGLQPPCVFHDLAMVAMVSMVLTCSH